MIMKKNKKLFVEYPTKVDAFFEATGLVEPTAPPSMKMGRAFKKMEAFKDHKWRRYAKSKYTIAGWNFR